MTKRTRARMQKRRRAFGMVPRATKLEREREVWRMTALCMTQRTIAEKLTEKGLGPISQVSVMRIQQRVEARMELDKREYVEHHRKTQLASLDKIAEESMVAWEESKQPKTTTTRRIGSTEADEDGNIDLGVTTKVVTETGPGDTAYLSEARAAMSDKRKILGLDAPLKTLNANIEMSWMDFLKMEAAKLNANRTENTSQAQTESATEAFLAAETGGEPTGTDSAAN